MSAKLRKRVKPVPGNQEQAHRNLRRTRRKTRINRNPGVISLCYLEVNRIHRVENGRYLNFPATLKSN